MNTPKIDDPMSCFDCRFRSMCRVFRHVEIAIQNETNLVRLVPVYAGLASVCVLYDDGTGDPYPGSE